MTATERTHKRRRKHGREAKAEEFSAFAAHAWATGTRDGNQKARSELWSLVGIGELGNGRNLPLCSHAAPRSARCSTMRLRSHVRSAVKTASWRAFAAVDTFGLVWLFSGHDTTHAIAAAGAVVGVE